jgi:hypothetical protein
MRVFHRRVLLKQHGLVSEKSRVHAAVKEVLKILARRSAENLCESSVQRACVRRCRNTGINLIEPLKIGGIEGPKLIFGRLRRGIVRFGTPDHPYA